MAELIIYPKNESERIKALYRYDILDTPTDGAFDRITALVSLILDVPIAIVSLVDTDRIWFKSHHGTDVSEIGRDPGLCTSAILDTIPYVISDTRLDPRTLVNPLVAGEFGLRFYAGVPLQTSDNFNLGTLCCLDFKPRVLTTEQISVLESLAKVVMDEMELRIAARRVDELNQRLIELHKTLEMQAAHDALTNIWNRGAVLDMLDKTLSRSKREGGSLSVMMIDIDFFKRVNDTYGHQAGDEVIIAVVKRLLNIIRFSDFMGRLGGEEFLCVLYPCNLGSAVEVAERCRKAVFANPITLGDSQQPTGLEVSISIGLASTCRHHGISAKELVKKADEALYQSKRDGRNRVSVSQ